MDLLYKPKCDNCGEFCGHADNPCEDWVPISAHTCFRLNCPVEKMIPKISIRTCRNKNRPCLFIKLKLRGEKRFFI